MIVEEGKVYVTKSGLVTSPVQRVLGDAPLLKWRGSVSGTKVWWLENGQYAEGGHAFDLSHEYGQDSPTPEPPVQRVAVVHQPDFVEQVLAAARDSAPAWAKPATVPTPPPVSVKPKTYLDVASEVLGEMVEMCDEALEFDPVSDLAASSSQDT